MPIEQILTIGAFGFTEDEYFTCLTGAGIDLLVDIRQRRGVRGAEYSFVNHKRLVAGLEQVGIAYLHELALAPTTAIRQTQYRIDDAAGVAKRRREQLSPEFIDAYSAQILAVADLAGMIEQWGEIGRRVALFCVEQEPAACHRSIAAEAIAKLIDGEPVHLTPTVTHT